MKKYCSTVLKFFYVGFSKVLVIGGLIEGGGKISNVEVVDVSGKGCVNGSFTLLKCN